MTGTETDLNLQSGGALLVDRDRDVTHLTQTRDGATVHGTYDLENRVKSWAGRSFAYDAAGQLVAVNDFAAGRRSYYAYRGPLPHLLTQRLLVHDIWFRQELCRDGMTRKRTTLSTVMDRQRNAGKSSPRQNDGRNYMVGTSSTLAAMPPAAREDRRTVDPRSARRPPPSCGA